MASDIQPTKWTCRAPTIQETAIAEIIRKCLQIASCDSYNLRRTVGSAEEKQPIGDQTRKNSPPFKIKLNSNELKSQINYYRMKYTSKQM